MTPVFLDTVGILALWDESDQWHSDADAAFQKLVADHLPMVTTTLVLYECGNAAARRPYRQHVDRLRRVLLQRDELLIPAEDDMEQAWTAYHQEPAGSAGIVDHISFVVMRRLGITRAFTNDQHFREQGFETLF
jgi:predicted nucleic acid-binding protein